MARKFLIMCLFALLGAGGAGAAETLTYADLVNRMTDLRYLATLPDVGETTAQFSSYARNSQYDATAGKYLDWANNGDSNGIIRKEGDNIVMAEMEGPGCIYRIWAATAKKGHVKIYLDGAETPAIDMPFEDFFNAKGVTPFDAPISNYEAARGLNSYVPIPYQKSCKIIAEPDWGSYYHFNYTTFPKGTVVPTFALPLPAADLAALNAARAVLDKFGEDPKSPVDGRCSSSVFNLTLNPGDNKDVVSFNEPAAIAALSAQLNMPETPADIRKLLRGLILKITWDGDNRPAVWSPLGDFFGTAPGVNSFKTLVNTVDETGRFQSFWYMPFAKATIAVENRNEVPVSFSFEVTSEPLTQPLEKLGRFHAKWHGDIEKSPEPERRIDWPLLRTTGRGRFCGVMLHIFNPKGGWWGEGDEKFHVDGEKFPSTFGTGSEDYFGYAWCHPGLFSRPYHAQSIAMGNEGHISVARYHLADQIPFQNTFEAYIEKYFPDATTWYDCVTYWYLAPGGEDPIQPTAVANMPAYRIPTQRVVADTMEGESAKVLFATGNAGHVQGLQNFEEALPQDKQHLSWSGQAHRFLRPDPSQAGDRIVFEIPGSRGGEHRLIVQLTKARDYGIVQVLVNDKKVGDPIDLYDPIVMPSGEIDLGVVELVTGAANTLTFEVVGKNPASSSYLVGVDYMRLVPISLADAGNLTEISGDQLILAAYGDAEIRRQNVDTAWKKDGHTWSGGSFLRIRDMVGGGADFAFPVEADGQYEVSVQWVKRGNYGRVQAGVDGKKMGPEVDLTGPDTDPTGWLKLGEMDLTKGRHELNVHITGGATGYKTTEVALEGIRLQKRN